MFLWDWLLIAVSWILVQFHTLFSTFMDPVSGLTWALSIAGLVLVIRILLIPLFVKQIKAQRNLQLIQPQIKEIQQKYKGDRDRQSQEMMALYKETGTNPFASCLPLLLQMPIFFALFQVLNGISNLSPKGVFTWPQYSDLLQQAHDAAILGAPLYGTFLGADDVAADGFNPVATRILSAILIVLMTATTFITQRQMLVKNVAADNPMVRQQRIMMYVFPFMFAVFGINFPIGVLIYWFSTNVWSMGQQFYVIRNNPQPGTPAAEAHERRTAEKEARKAVKRGEFTTVEEALAPEPQEQPKRVQPRNQPKSKRKKGKT